MPANHPKVGARITGPAFRDAIHIAVAPIEAGEPLAVGQLVWLINGKGFATPLAKRAKAIGIVDPFLPHARGVSQGERFWLFLLPDTITSLRHEWTHPAFESETAIPDDIKAASKQWLEDFLLLKDWPPYDDFIKLMTQGFTTRETDDGYEDNYSVHIGNGYMSFSGEMGHGSVPPEFWTHLEIVTGKKFPHHPRSFSCSC